MYKFIQDLIKAHSKLTDRTYTLHLLNKLIEDNFEECPNLIFVDIGQRKNGVINIRVSPRINNISNKDVNGMLEMFLEQLTGPESDSGDLFRSMLKVSMDGALRQVLEERGVFI